MFNQELWTKDFAANLYDAKDWYRIGLNWNKYVLGSIAHIPRFGSGASVSAITNSTSLPVAATRQEFDELTYSMKMLGLNTYVTNIDAAEASFDTRTATLEDITNQLKQAISLEIANAWNVVASGSIVRTSGTSTRSNIYGQASIKKLTYADILSARSKMVINTKNTNLEGLYLIVDPLLYADILDMSEFKSASELGGKTIVSGYVGEIAGIKVIQRAYGIAVTSALAKPSTILYDDSYANTHFSCALLVDASKVGYSLGTMENGEIKVGIEQYAMGYYTDRLQAHTRVGASQLYKVVSDIVPGVISIIETA